LLASWDEEAGEDGATQDIATKAGGHYSNSDDDLTLLQIDSDAEPAKDEAATNSAGTRQNNDKGHIIAF
jgi:hypothetical protein